MTTRSESVARRRALILDITADLAQGKTTAGHQIASLAELAARYKLSKPTVATALGPLVEDGAVSIVPSVGVFAGTRRPRHNGTYVVLVAASERVRLQTHDSVTAFAEQARSYGGRSVLLDVEAFLNPEMRESLGPVLGVFSFSGGRVEEVADAVGEELPIVRYGRGEPQTSATDVISVDVDNKVGGQMATTELLSAGRRSVAFIGLHRSGSGLHRWSQARADGWEHVMRRHNPRGTLLRIEPHRDEPDPSRCGEMVAKDAAAQVIGQEACVGADDRVLIALASQLNQLGVPRQRWPQMVGFEDLPAAAAFAAGSVCPDWSGMGALAARQLFDRARGREPRGNDHLAGMRLVRY